MMTNAEAAEVLLKNEPLITCSNCGGDGKDYSEDVYGYISLIACKVCAGFGFKLAVQYAKACTIAGIKPPTVKELMESGVHLK